MLSVGVIVIRMRNAEACPPYLHAFGEDPRRLHHQPFAWTAAAEGGFEVRIPISKENLAIAADFHRDPGFKVRCEFDTLVDPFFIPEALPPKDPDMVPADPAWAPEADELSDDDSGEADEPTQPEVAGDVPASTKRKYTKRQ